MIPYSVHAYADDEWTMAAGQSHKIIKRQRSIAMWESGTNCTVPCTFFSNWLGYAIFSYGAMLKMESYIRNNELINACRIWRTTHDIGLGIFVWEMSIPLLPGKII